MYTCILKFFKNRKLRTKLLLSYIFVVLLPVLLINSFLIGRIKETVLNQTRYINQVSFNQLRDNMYHQLQNYLNLSDNTQTETQFTDYLSTNYSKYNSIINVYTGFQSFKDAYAVKFGNKNDNVNVNFYSTNKTLLFDERKVFFLNERDKEQDWYKAIMEEKGGNSIGLYYSDTDKEYYVYIGRLINLEPITEYTSLLLMKISESGLYKLMEKEGENKSIYLLDRNNNIISATDRTIIGKNTKDLDVFKSIKLYNTMNTSLDIDNGNMVAYISSFNDKSAIDGWKIVSFVSSMTLMKEINNIVGYGVIISSISIGIVIIFVLIFSDTITRRLRLLMRNMRKVQEGSFEVTASFEECDEIGELSKGFKLMVERINALIEEVYKADMFVKDLTIKNKEAEIKALQSQINPHFLFNTMETIRMSLLKQNDIVNSNIIQNFAKLFRKSIDWSEDMISLRQEADLIESYMKIHKYRFRERFNYRIDLSEDILDYLIPKFTLQPIVENAICHGLEMKNGAGMIKIFSICTNSDLRIVVQDDGTGIDSFELELIKQRLNHEGQNTGDEKGMIGMVNVHDRIRLHYGEGYGIDIKSEKNAGTIVEIILPLKNCEEDFHV